MKIQFVCVGNTFRSRIAEAYLKSKKIPDLTVSSSGIRDDRDLNGSVCNYTVQILSKNNLIHYLSRGWVMTKKRRH